MAFQPVANFKFTRFNSAVSSNFLDFYENSVDDFIRQQEAEKPSKTFAPSSIRCKRISWFRLRGVDPESETTVDRGLQFTADMGTACHHVIQSTLISSMGENWLNVKDYLANLNPPYKYNCEQLGYETRIEIIDPPIKFAPDGLINFENEVMLLEIKSSDHNSFEKLTDVKSNHVDQVKCYCTLLNVHRALVLYQDRMYGNLKCYEVRVSDSDMQDMWKMFSDVQEFVKMNIPPPKPLDNRYCTPSYCRYYERCKQW